MKPPETLTLRRVFLFWMPLAATWLMMAAEGPFLAAVIARLAEPKYNLAAYGVAFSLALVVEAPIIMMLSAATALVRDRQSYLAMRHFSAALNGLVTLVMALILIPPVFDFIADGLLGLPGDVAQRTHLAVLILLPWPGAIGIRRFYQGVLIRHGLTRRVAYGTVVRLGAMAATALALYRVPGLEGVWVGAAALSAGVILEAVAARAMAHRIIRSLLGTPTADNVEALSYREIATFYFPLALTTFLSIGLLPVVTFFMGHSRDSLSSLAVLPVVSSLVFLFRALGLAFQEVGIALVGDRQEGYPALRQFTVLLGAAVVAGLALIAWTPLTTVWYQHISGLSAELTAFALLPTRLMVIIPGITVLLSFQRAMLVNLKATAQITWAAVIEVIGVVGGLLAGVVLLDAVGAVAAAVALVLGRVGANIYLVPQLRRLRRGVRDAESEPPFSSNVQKTY